MHIYRLELKIGNSWRYVGKYKTIQSAWRKAQELMGIGQTTTRYNKTGYRIVDANELITIEESPNHPIMLAKNHLGRIEESWVI